MNARHVWTAAEDAVLIDMAARGVPCDERAAHFKMTTRAVAWHLTQLRAGRRAPIDPEIPIDVEEPPLAEDFVAAQFQRERVEKLVKLTKSGVALEELCDRMDLSPKRARELIVEAQQLGFIVDIEGPHVGHRPAVSNSDVRDVRIDPAGGKLVFAQITDLHFGSRYHLNAQLHDFVKRAYARGVRTILVTGDVLEGCYRHAQWELTHHGFYDQASYCAEAMPKHDGLTYHFITGNHDQTFSDANGMSAGRALVEVFNAHGRKDLVFHGDRGARIRLAARENERGLVVALWHPLKGPAYALSYKLQKYIEQLPVGRKPDVVFAGHWHQSVYFTTRGVHAFSGGCFQGGFGPYGEALGGSPSIGGWIVEYAQTATGTVRSFSPEWVAYFESETPRDVAVS